MRSGLLILLAGVGLVFSSGPLRADDCVIYQRAQAGMGEQLLSIFSWFRDAAVRECITPQGQKKYYVLTKPRPVQFGVCQYNEFPMSKSPQVQRVIMMSPPKQDCPEAGGAAYVVTSLVTPGAYLSLAQYWERLAARPALLDRETEDVRKSAIFQGLQRTISSKQPMRLATVRLLSKSDGTPPLYELTVRSQSAAWTLLVDSGPKGVELRGVGTAN